MDRICRNCQHPEYQHPVVRFTEDEGVPVTICSDFESAGTLNDIWHSKIAPVRRPVCVVHGPVPVDDDGRCASCGMTTNLETVWQ